MATSPIDLSAGFVPKSPQIDLSAGFVPKSQAPAENSGPKGFFHSFADATGLSALAHPIDTIANLPSSIVGEAKRSASQLKEAWDTPNNQPLKAIDRTLYAIPFVGGSLKTADEQAAQGNYRGAAGSSAGVMASLMAPGAMKEAAPAVTGAIAEGAGKAATTIGEALKASAIKTMNRAVGALQGDFERGTNIGRGYVDAKLGPSSSMQSIATKAGTAADSVGNQLGQIYKSATDSGHLIPVSKVEQALTSPLGTAYDLETGVGGTGNTGSLDAYSQGIKDAITKADAKGGFTPSELFDIKDRIAKQTNWADASQKTLNGVRQNQVGAISGILSDELPDTGPLNQAYGDLRTLADRAQHRANTGSQPLSASMAQNVASTVGAGLGAAVAGPEGAIVGSQAGRVVRAVPVKTAIASAKDYVGGKLVDVGQSMGSSPKDLPGQVFAPQSGLSGSDLWASRGEAKLTQHLQKAVPGGVSSEDIANLGKTSQGRDLLIRASDLTPGSRAMQDIVRQIKIIGGAQ